MGGYSFIWGLNKKLVVTTIKIMFLCRYNNKLHRYEHVYEKSAQNIKNSTFLPSFSFFEMCCFHNICPQQVIYDGFRWFFTSFDQYWQIWDWLLKFQYFRIEKSHILPATFCGGYPVWKYELWLDPSNNTQIHHSAVCDHEFWTVGEQPTDFFMNTRHVIRICCWCSLSVAMLVCKWRVTNKASGH